MSIKKLTALFIFFFIIITFFTTPISLIVKKITLPKNVSYEQLSGTIWYGTANAIQVDNVTLTQVDWQFLPWQIFTGKAAFKIRWGSVRSTNDISGNAIASLGFAGYQLTDAIVRIPANRLKSLSPFPIGDLQGKIIAELDVYTYGQPFCQSLSGDLMWTKAGIDMSGLIDFGVISSTLACDNNQIVVTFDGKSKLGLQGEARIKSTKLFAFDGFLKPSQDLPAVVHQGIGILGKADDKGRYKIKL